MKQANRYLINYRPSWPALLLTVSFLWGFPGWAQSRLPNVVIIYADDLGYGDLSSYGGTIPTPNIDQIGRNGIRFTDFYVSAPVCTPSRYSLLTGSYPQRSVHGLNKALMPVDTNYLDASETTMADYLKAKGYRTALIGKWHLGAKDTTDLPTRHGFDVFSGFKPGCIDYFTHVYGGMGRNWFVNGRAAAETGYATELITRHAGEFIDQVKSDKAPFFLYLPYNAPHFGKTDPGNQPDLTLSLKEGIYEGYQIMNSLQAPAAYVKKFAHITDPYRRVYSAMVANLDDQVGVLLAKLEREKLLDNTMIWFISDNGGYSKTYFGHASNGNLRGEKAQLWEGGIRVPALVSWKGRIKPGQIIRSPVSTVDILPTLGALLGFARQLPANRMDGRDISNVLLRGKPLSRSLFWQFGRQTALRNGDWKLVNGTDLYNLRTDPGETTNLATTQPEQLAALRREYETTRWQIANKEASHR